MKLTFTALGILLGSMVAAAPASAQYASQPSPQTADAPKGESQAAGPASQARISSGARKEIAALQKVVNAKDVANIPAALAAAKAKAKTKDDHYVIAQLQLKAAADANDNAAGIVALQAAIDSGFLKPADQMPIMINIGKLQYNAKAYDPAAKAFEDVLKIDPNHLDAATLLAETRVSQGRPAEAVALIQKAIGIRSAGGQKAEENWYKRAVALSYNAKLPNVSETTRQWVAAYPTGKNWRDTLRIYETEGRPVETAQLDAMRLARVTGALVSENDYFRYANALITKGFPGEAKEVLEEGFAAKAIDKSRPTFSQIYALATTRAQGDRATLDASAKTALAAPAARQAMVTAEAYYGYREYQKAADLFRAALGKQGVDKDVANLRLGMALAQAGDKAGATAAFNAAGGAQAEVAKFWLTHLKTKA